MRLLTLLSLLALGSGSYHSSHKTVSFENGNLNDPAHLKDVLTKRSYRNEIILISFDKASIGEIYHHARMLQHHVLYWHFLVLGLDDEACKSLKTYWGSELHWPGCGWITLPGNTTASNPHGVYRLWLQRYLVAAKALEHGLNVLVADLDTTFNHEFYKDVKESQFSKHNMFTMTAELNGGLWYIQNAQKDGPLVWMLHEVVKRGTAIMTFTGLTGDLVAEGCTPMDQAIMGEVFAVFTHGIELNRWPCLPLKPSPVWKTIDASIEPGPTGPNTMGVSWETIQLNTKHISNHQRQAPFPQEFEVVYGFNLSKSGIVETVLRAPETLFSTWETLLADYEGYPNGYSAVNHLVLFGHAYGTQKGGHLNRWHLIKARGLWYGRLDLERDASYGMASKELIHRYQNDYPKLLRMVITWALDNKMIPVIPAIPCNASTIEKNKPGRHGAGAGWEARFISLSNGMCYPFQSLQGGCTEREAMPQFFVDGAVRMRPHVDLRVTELTMEYREDVPSSYPCRDYV